MHLNTLILTFLVDLLDLHELSIASRADDVNQRLFICSQTLQTHRHYVSRSSRFHSHFIYTVKIQLKVINIPFTLMEALISEASYWAVLFMRPRMTVSREPDSAAFRAEIISWTWDKWVLLLKMDKATLIQKHIIYTLTFLALLSYAKAISRRWLYVRLVRTSIMVCSSTPKTNIVIVIYLVNQNVTLPYSNIIQ